VLVEPRSLPEFDSFGRNLCCDSTWAFVAEIIRNTMDAMVLGSSSLLMNASAEKLSSLHIFAGLTKEDATAVWRSVVQKRFDAGTQILEEGAGVQALWIILEGECIVSRSCGTSGVRELAQLKAGDVFGEMSFIRTAPHSANIVAKTDVLTCAWRRKDFLKLAQESPHAGYQIAANIAAVLAERLRRMDYWICDLMARPDTQSHRDEWEKFRSAVYTNWQF